MNIKDEFWKKYIEADYFEQKDLLKTLPLLKDLPKLKNIKEDNVFEYIIIGLFQDYIEDAISVAKKKQGE